MSNVHKMIIIAPVKSNNNNNNNKRFIVQVISDIKLDIRHILMTFL